MEEIEAREATSWPFQEEIFSSENGGYAVPWFCSEVIFTVVSYTQS